LSGSRLATGVQTAGKTRGLIVRRSGADGAHQEGRRIVAETDHAIAVVAAATLALRTLGAFGPQRAFT
jgi:hypothetical protein